MWNDVLRSVVIDVLRSDVMALVRCSLVGVVLVSCGRIWLVYARRNDVGMMISAVLS